MGGPGGSPMGGMDINADELDENTQVARVYSFIIQMAWQPRTVAQRNEAKRLRLELEAQAAQAAAQAEQAAAAEDEFQ